MSMKLRFRTAALAVVVTLALACGRIGQLEPADDAGQEAGTDSGSNSRCGALDRARCGSTPGCVAALCALCDGAQMFAACWEPGVDRFPVCPPELPCSN